MIKICEICNEKFDTNSHSRIYCYKCSGESSRKENITRKHQKTILRRSMKIQAIKLLGGKCSKCILVCSNCHKEIHAEIGYSNINN